MHESELGVQIPDNKIYRKINRGHSVEQVIEALEFWKMLGLR